MIATAKEIYIGNAYLVRLQFTAYDPQTGEFVAWTPANMSCKIVSTETGTTPITGLGPFSMSPSPGAVGEAYYAIPSSAVANLDSAAYINRFVYLVVQGGANNEVDIVVPLRVLKPRMIAA